MMRTSLRFAYLLTGILLIVQVASAQNGTGFPPFGSFSGGPFDTINNGNLNIHFEIPIFYKAGRGLPFNAALTYDSSIWRDVQGSWVRDQQWGWRTRSETITGFLGYTLTPAPCRQGFPTPQNYTYTNFVYYDPHGGTHTFPGFQLFDNSQCPSGQHASGNTTATDGSALYLSANTSGVPQIPLNATITLPSGNVITPFNGPYNYPVIGAGTVVDTNGNTITVGTTSVSDTLNTTPLTFTSPGVYTYPGPSTNESVTVNSSPATVQTIFGCANEQAPYSTSLVSSILLPDGSSYSFTYEPTPGVPANTTGRIQSVTLPTGGTIHYTYGSFVCNLGAPYLSSLTRQTPDGTWTYTLAHPGTAYWTTTITAPQDAQGKQPKTVISLVNTSVGIYETQRMVYADTTSTTPLVTVDTCYNGHTSPCPQDPTNITTPFTQIQVTKTLAARSRPGQSPCMSLTVCRPKSMSTTSVLRWSVRPSLLTQQTSA
jgi:hypothetical protein